jgi:hypothetical protein
MKKLSLIGILTLKENSYLRQFWFGIEQHPRIFDVGK